MGALNSKLKTDLTEVHSDTRYLPSQRNYETPEVQQNHQLFRTLQTTPKKTQGRSNPQTYGEAIFTRDAG
nr:hypothetical protein HmN_000357900 [Hymenolepis microstoma]